MPNEFKIAAISLDIKTADKSSNLKSLEDLLPSVDNDVDLIVLPELFSTGYTSSRDTLGFLAESNNGDTMAFIHDVSRRYNAAVTGSFLAKTGTAITNRASFIEPGGDELYYDKRHLFSMSSEADLLTSGDRPMPVVRYRGWNLAIAVCYDLRFPVWCRNKGLEYDALIVVANWPDARKYAWSHLLIARAIENQAYVLGADRSGSDKFGCYDLMTEAYDYCGKKLETVPSPASAAVCRFVLDHNALDHWRRDFAAWRDADAFSVIM